MNSKHALVVIDMQQVAFDGQITPPINDGEEVLKNVGILINQCRLADIQIVYVQTKAVAGQPYAEDAHGWEIHPSISPQKTDLTVYKQGSSGFDNTALDQELRALGTQVLITCGNWSEYCLANTSLDALKQGFEVYVAAEGHGTVADSNEAARAIVSQQNHRLEQSGAHVLASDALQQFLQSIPDQHSA